MSDADCTPGREPRSVAASNMCIINRQPWQWMAWMLMQLLKRIVMKQQLSTRCSEWQRKTERGEATYAQFVASSFVRSFSGKLISHEYLTQRHDKLQVRMLCHTTSEKGWLQIWTENLPHLWTCSSEVLIRNCNQVTLSFTITKLWDFSLTPKTLAKI